MGMTSLQDCMNPATMAMMYDGDVLTDPAALSTLVF